MVAALLRNKLRVLLILLVFGVFLFNAAGLLELKLNIGTGLVFRYRFLTQMVGQGIIPGMYLAPDFLVFVFIGLVMSMSLPVLSPIRASLVTFICMLLPLWMTYAAPVRPAAIPMEYTLLTILILYVVNVLASYFAETHSKQRLIGIFGHYVPPELVQAIARDPDGLSMDGEARELTVFFSDIKNFSTISEHLEPRQLARMLNTYFTAMTDVLHRHGATIDKYIGDAIMAFWGAPLPQPDHARRSVMAALAMQDDLVRLRASFRERGWPELDVGVGINTGVMNVGNMGSRYRVAYTVVGDAVNLSSRVEHLTRIYNAKVLVTEATARAVTDVVFKEVDHVRVKGKGNSTRIFEPLCPRAQADRDLLHRLSLHERALAAYYRRDWDTAQDMFTQLRDAGFNPGCCALFLGRVAAYRDAPPSQDWSGVTVYGAG